MMKRIVIYSIIVLIILVAVVSSWYYFSNRPAYVAPQEATQAQFQITVNPSIIVSKNNLQIGFQPAFQKGDILERTDILSIIKETKPKIVRFFDYRTSTDAPYFEDPCLFWNETNNSKSTWDWTFVDSLIRNITSMGAEPLICLGHSSGQDSVNLLPKGMTINLVTGLPYPEQFAAYARTWVKHFNEKKYPVKYYEIWNEPFTYFGWGGSDATKLGYWITLWNKTEIEMHKENSSILIGNDHSTAKKVFNKFNSSNANLGFLSFHKYDTENPLESDSSLFNKAETKFILSGDTYGLKEARTLWSSSHQGKTLEVIQSEGNMNSNTTHTDPRLQKISNAVWNAMVLRKEALEGVKYHVYYDEWSGARADGSLYGWGYVNWSSKTRLYPFYVYKWIGNNLNAGDNIVSSTSTTNIRTLAWINNGNLNIMLIHNSTSTETVSLNGVAGQLNYQKIDDPTGTKYKNPSIPQTITIDASNVITLNGYTVIFLNKTLCTPKTCTQLGKQCGTWDDRCGTNLNCGTCISPKTCNSTGQCICTPKTCNDYPSKCGSLSDGCSGTITCSCASGYSCQSGSCVYSLVSYWKFDEGSGTKAYDYMKLNNGTLMNMETVDWVTGKYGKALKFDGVNEYVDCGSKASLNLNAFSITVWVNPTSVSGYKTIVRKAGASSADTNYALDLDSGNTKVRFFVYDTSGNYHGVMATTKSVSLNKWTHIAATYDGTTFKVYINGTQDATTATWSGSIKTTTGSLKIGSSTSLNYFNGTIDEVKIWNRSLTQEEITKVYNNQL